MSPVPALVISAARQRRDRARAAGAGPSPRHRANSGSRSLEATPRGHKIALRLIRAGEAVMKYGSPIGTATGDIPAGRPRPYPQRRERSRTRRLLHAERRLPRPTTAEPPHRRARPISRQ